MPPSAAPEWLRTGWIFEISATSAPCSWASIAARMPAQPAPTMRTSCFASTTSDAIRSSRKRASDARTGRDDVLVGPELLEVLLEAARQVRRLLVVGGRIAPGGARIEELPVHARHLDRNVEAEDRILPVLHVVELAVQGGAQERARRG